MYFSVYVFIVKGIFSSKKKESLNSQNIKFSGCKACQYTSLSVRYRAFFYIYSMRYNGMSFISDNKAEIPFRNYFDSFDSFCTGKRRSFAGQLHSKCHLR